MSTRLALVPERRDKRGRRIGFNWWREYNCRIVQDANDAVAALRESKACYQMEPEEFRAAHPLVTLKQCLIENEGMSRQAVA